MIFTEMFRLFSPSICLESTYLHDLHKINVAYGGNNEGINNLIIP